MQPFKPIDLIAGLSMAGILLPEAVAYAAIAHLSIQAGITALLVGLTCYALFGASRFAIVSPTSSSATLLAAAAVSLMPSGSHEQAALSFALVMLTGVGLIAMASIRLGRLSAFVSRPVLYGFSFALALTIIIKQLPVVTGVHIVMNGHNATLYTLLEDLFAQRPQWSGWSIAFGLSSLFLLVILRRFTKLPAAFVVLVVGIGLAYSADLSALGIAMVGPVTFTAPGLTVPDLSMRQWLNAAELALGLLVIVFAESWASIRSLALRHGDQVEPNRELLAIGMANLASGLLRGVPVGAGFSASMANETAGAQSKGSGIIAAAAIFILILLGQPLIEHIPQPVLAAIVIGALLHALNLQPLVVLWRLNRDQYLSLAALASVLVFGVLHGMLIAVALSIASAIRTFIQPTVHELTELDATRNYVDCDNHPEAKPHKHILILRPEEPLFFASVEGMLDVIKARVLARPDCKIVIVSLEQSSDLDSTATDNLVELAKGLKSDGVVLLLARVKDPVRLLLLKTAPDCFQHTLFWSVADAATEAERLIHQQPA